MICHLIDCLSSMIAESKVASPQIVLDSVKGTLKGSVCLCHLNAGCELN